MKLDPQLFAVVLMTGLISTMVFSSASAALPQTTIAKSSPKKDLELIKLINNLRSLHDNLRNKVTNCNGGRILVKACPEPTETTGDGSLVKALRQTKQTIDTLELYDSNLKKIAQPALHDYFDDSEQGDLVVIRMINILRYVQRELEEKVTVCNGGKVLTRACPNSERIGSGSLVRAMRQTTQILTTLELHLDPSLDKNNLQ
jgi:hypothetical protein